MLALNCLMLEHLDMSFCGSAVSDSSLASIGRHLSEIRFLSVRGCIRVTGVGVESVVENCQKLEKFDVSQCRSILPWLRSGGITRARPGLHWCVIKGRW